MLLPPPLRLERDRDDEVNRGRLLLCKWALALDEKMMGKRGMKDKVEKTSKVFAKLRKHEKVF